MALFKELSRSETLKRIEALIDEAAGKATAWANREREMRELYNFVYKGTPEEKVETFVWMVPSRSGNAAHYVSQEGETWTCTCDAHKSDRECWALRGIRNNYQHKDRRSFTFVDPRYYESHYATYLSE